MFGERGRFPAMEKLSRITGVRVPVGVNSGGDFAKELAYRNRRSAERFSEEVWEQVTGGVATGRAIAFSVAQECGIIGLRVSPLGMVQERDKRCLNHDLTFETKPEAPGELGSTPVNAMTDWDKIPECILSDRPHTRYAKPGKRVIATWRRASS